LVIISDKNLATLVKFRGSGMAAPSSGGRRRQAARTPCRRRRGCSSASAPSCTPASAPGGTPREERSGTFGPEPGANVMITLLVQFFPNFAKLFGKILPIFPLDAEMILENECYVFFS
jgi:hypothetical protein